MLNAEWAFGVTRHSSLVTRHSHELRASWPFSILKAIRTKVVAGKSPAFMGIIEAGYVAGILFKLTAPGPTDPTVWLYVLNLVIVGTDLALYFRYRHNVPPAA